jgi:hypothetical protein
VVAVDLARPGRHAFEPSRLRFETGRLYKLVLNNPSDESHYFTSHAFTQLIFTRKLQVVQSRDGKTHADHGMIGEHHRIGQPASAARPVMRRLSPAPSALGLA